ncbi:MAG: hypothetical protein D6738_13875 [Acidobacteria bacterium]|nr:MAG: hypothetical protein D6738_13875 [Acidobacteriota bacterium]
MTRRLSSWKEIAAHLGVSVRTAQNWERRFGMPVHRLGEGPRAHVFAEPDELDAWLAAAARSAPGSAPPRRRGLPVRRLLPAGLALVAAAVLLTAAVRIGAGAWRAAPRHAPEPAGVEVVDGRLVVIGPAGSQGWSIPLAGLAVDHYGDALAGASGPFHRLFDLDDDGSRELLFVETPADRRVRSSALACYDDTGRRLWRTPLAEPLEWNGETFHGFSGRILEIVQAPERTYVVTTASNTRFPAQVALIDLRSGARVGVFVHPGRVYAHALADITDDGRPELLLGLANNPGPGLGHAALAALEIPFPPPSATGRDLFGRPAVRPLRYYMFARPDVYDVEPLVHAVRRIEVGPEGIVVTVGSRKDVLFEFDRHLEPVRAAVSDNLRRWHARQFAAGLLDHPFDAREADALTRLARWVTVPDGNSPEVAARLGETGPRAPRLARSR